MQEAGESKYDTHSLQLFRIFKIDGTIGSIIHNTFVVNQLLHNFESSK